MFATTECYAGEVLPSSIPGCEQWSTQTHTISKHIPDLLPLCIRTQPAGKYLLLKVQKRPGKESEPLLPAADDMDAVAASAAAAKASNVINVFTVASGHMYERLQKIMILSVIKNTKSR
jgi:hypothetical protein